MDLHMYHEESDTPALARTSNLNEDLGVVRSREGGEDEREASAGLWHARAT